MGTKAAKLKVINVLLAIDLVIVAITALLHPIIVDLGLYRLLHVLPGTLFLLLVFSHLILNRGWIKSTYFKKRS